MRYDQKVQRIEANLSGVSPLIRHRIADIMLSRSVSAIA